jgi:putative Mn2+ efflux pump MntP
MDGGWIEQGIFHNEMTVLGCFIHSFHAWFWCLTIFAWGSHLLNKRSSSLTYLNQGVYPFYIVHMPITFVGLKIAKVLNFTGILAVIAGCLIVIIGCWLVFEGVSRTRITRYLFGIKNIQQKQSVVTQDVS